MRLSWILSPEENLFICGVAYKYTVYNIAFWDQICFIQHTFFTGFLEELPCFNAGESGLSWNNEEASSELSGLPLKVLLPPSTKPPRENFWPPIGNAADWVIRLRKALSGKPNRMRLSDFPSVFSTYLPSPLSPTHDGQKPRGAISAIRLYSHAKTFNRYLWGKKERESEADLSWMRGRIWRWPVYCRWRVEGCGWLGASAVPFKFLRAEVLRLATGGFETRVHQIMLFAFSKPRLY